MCRYDCQIWFLGNFGLRSSALTTHSDPWVFCLEVVDLLRWFIECAILLSCGIFTVWKTFCAYYHLPHAFNLFWVILQGPSPWYPSTSEHNADIHSVWTADAQLLLILNTALLCYLFFIFQIQGICALEKKTRLKAKTTCAVDGTISKWPNGINEPRERDLPVVTLATCYLVGDTLEMTWHKVAQSALGSSVLWHYLNIFFLCAG